MRKIERLEEFKINAKKQEAISGLLQKCFRDYPSGRSYYKQLPHFRFLVWENRELIGHMSVEHRLVNNSGVLYRVFGIGDLCIAPGHQRKNVASELLEKLERLAIKHHIDFLLLISKAKPFYKKNKFKLVNNICKWVIINEHLTFGISNRPLDDCLQVKALGNKKWKKGTVDFLGHMI